MITAEDKTVSSTRTGTTSRRSSSTASSKRKKSNVKAATPEEIAATRHLRLVVESIAENNALSRQDKAARMKNFETLVENVETKLHYGGNGGGVGGGGMVMKPELLLESGSNRRKTNNKNNNKSANNNNGKTKKKSLFGQIMLKRKDSSQKKNTIKGGLVSPKNHLTSVLEGLEEARGEVEEQRRKDFGLDDNENRAEPEIVDTDISVAADDRLGQVVGFNNDAYNDDDDATCTDSIIDARMANSEDYTASICSIRSLGTFEKDFIQNIIAEQEAQYDEISVSTFEQDMGTRNVAAAAGRPSNRFIPTQVNIGEGGAGAVDENDDLTLGTAQSETTFEQDAKRNGLVGGGAGGVPPMQINFSNDVRDEYGDEENDDLTVDDARSETTFEQDAHAVDDARSETTFEQDAHDREERHQENYENQYQHQQQQVRERKCVDEEQVAVVPPTSPQPSANNHRAAPPTPTPKPATTTATNATTQVSTPRPTPAPIQPTNVFIPGPVQKAASADSERSVSTFEKDAMAYNMLAKKIGRIPSIQPRSPLSDMATRLEKDDDEESTNTFEKDFKVRNSMSGKKAANVAPVSTVTADRNNEDDLMATPKCNPNTQSTFPEPFIPPAEISVTRTDSKVSGGSVYGIEKDAKQIHQSQPNPTKLGNDELLGFERDVSRNMNRQTSIPSKSGVGGLAAANASASAAVTPTPHNNLVVELSPNALDRGLKKGKTPSIFSNFFSRGFCHLSVVP